MEAVISQIVRFQSCVKGLLSFSHIVPPDFDVFGKECKSGIIRYPQILKFGLMTLLNNFAIERNLHVCNIDESFLRELFFELS